jgi:colanic acid/amylovoran biosynthesis glycosyltransferase
MLPSVVASDGDTEGTPVSLMEAQALGMPVLSTRHAGIPEIVADGEAGYLVPEKDVAALAERLIFLADHPGLWPALGRAGRCGMEERHSLSKLNRDLVEIYRKVIARKA